MTGLAPFFLSLAVIAMLALVWGGIRLIRTSEDRKKGILMLITATVLLGNVLILTWP